MTVQTAAASLVLLCLSFLPFSLRAGWIQRQPVSEVNPSFSVISTVHVLVFPHAEVYTAPHGRDTTLTEVTLISEDKCQIKTGRGTINRYPTNGRTVLNFKLDQLKETQTVHCSKPVTVLRETGLRANTYLGDFKIKAGTTSQNVPTIQVINEIEFETYLRGVVPAEMPSSWPLEALKAQSVTARTFGYNQILNARSNPVDSDIDIDDTVFFQAYLGLGAHTPEADKAVQSTSGQILMHDDFPIIAFFSADSGGYTESASNVWPINAPYCVSKQEVYDTELVSSDWTASLTLSDIESRLKKAGAMTQNLSLQKIDIIDSERFQSGRTSVVHLAFRNSSSRAIAATDFRLHLGLRSTLFSFVEKQTKTGEPLYVFKGKGYGHGVGMNQWGAKTLAQSLGWTYKKILTFYYSNIAFLKVKPSH